MSGIHNIYTVICESGRIYIGKSGAKPLSSEFEYIASISQKLEGGKWIAVVGKEIVAEGDGGMEVFEKAKKKYPDREVFVMRVPSDSVMLL